MQKKMREQRKSLDYSEIYICIFVFNMEQQKVTKCKSLQNKSTVVTQIRKIPLSKLPIMCSDNNYNVSVAQFATFLQVVVSMQCSFISCRVTCSLAHYTTAVQFDLQWIDVTPETYVVLKRLFSSQNLTPNFNQKTSHGFVLPHLNGHATCLHFPSHPST